MKYITDCYYSSALGSVSVSSSNIARFVNHAFSQDRILLFICVELFLDMQSNFVLFYILLKSNVTLPYTVYGKTFEEKNFFGLELKMNIHG